MGGGHVSQLDFGGDVPNGVYAGRAGLELPVHQNPAPLHVHGKALAEEPLRVGPAADGAQNRLPPGLTGLVLAGVADHQPAVRVLLHRADHTAGMYRHAPAFKNHRHILADFPVHVGQNPVHGLHDCHLTAHGLIDAGQLHADNPAADDDQGAIDPLLGGQHIVRGDGVLKAGDRGPRGHRAGGD